MVLDKFELVAAPAAPVPNGAVASKVVAQVIKARLAAAKILRNFLRGAGVWAWFEVRFFCACFLFVVVVVLLRE